MNKSYVEALWIDGDLDMSLFILGITLQGYRHRSELNSI